jgi:hypothetical protein
VITTTASKIRLRFGLVFSLLLVALTLSGCFVRTALQATRSPPSGTIQLVSAALGTHNLTPSACASGERLVFLGADFLDGEGITTRLIIEPTGDFTLRFFPTTQPLESGVLFQRADCSQFDLYFEHTGWRINDILDFHVEIDFNCRTASGDAAQGFIFAEHCH